LAFNTGSDPPRILTRVYGPPRALVMLSQSWTMLSKRREYGDENSGPRQLAIRRRSLRAWSFGAAQDASAT
jgi:hypothetical protein